MICPTCRTPVERHSWQPWNVSGKLVIACWCGSCGHRWPVKAEMIVKPTGVPPWSDTAPIAPVDLDRH